MKTSLLSLFVVGLSFSVFAEESFIYPVPNLEKKLQRSLDTLEDDPKACAQMKTAEDPECQVSLGWGHTRDAHYDLEDNKKCGIGMGCNSGEAGVGALKDKDQYWRWQRGSNGTYSNYSQQGTQNGGLNPVIFDGNDYHGAEGKFNKNSYLGFMRLTQYHWLQLHNYAKDELLGKSCSSVRIEFICPDAEADLDDKELKKRLTAYKTKMPIGATVFEKKYASELQIMNRVTPLNGCFSGNKPDALPEKCGQKIDITASKKIAKHCQAWVKSIQEKPQHDWETSRSLPRPEKYNYPQNGPVN